MVIHARSHTYESGIREYDTHTHTYNAAKNVQNPTKRKIQESENPIILRWKKPTICQFQRSEY